MPFLDTEIQNSARRVKEISHQLMETIELSHAELAGELKVSEQSISRWFHPFDDSNLPAFVVKRCIESKNEKISRFGLSLAKYCTGDAGYSVVVNLPVIELNGSLKDEVCATVTELGVLSSHTDIPIERAGELLDSVDNALAYLYGMKEEIRRKVGKR